jgi:hypothetical protein
MAQALQTPSQREVSRRLVRLVDQIPAVGCTLIGPLDPNRQLLRMLKESADGRHVTWKKVMGQIAAAVYNEPQDMVRDCWLVPASAGEEFKIHKLDSGGSGNKWRSQQIIYCASRPYDHNRATHSPVPGFDNHISHLCGVSFPRHYACVNPNHLVGEPPQANEDRKGCRYGNAYQCPHVPKCRFTDPDTGCVKPCISDELGPLIVCQHGRNCYDLGTMVTDDLISYRPSTAGSTGGDPPSSPLSMQAQADLEADQRSIESEARRQGEFGLSRRRP